MMRSLTIKSYLFVFLSFFFGLLLMFIQLPVRLQWLEPQWIVLVLLYFALMMPLHVNVGFAWFAGIFLDFVYSVPIGENGLALVLISYLLIKFRQKILYLGFWQISLVIFGLVMLYQAILFLLQTYLGNYFDPWDILGGALTSAIIWPLIAVLLINFQRRYQI